MKSKNLLEIFLISQFAFILVKIYGVLILKNYFKIVNL